MKKIKRFYSKFMLYSARCLITYGMALNKNIDFENFQETVKQQKLSRVPNNFLTVNKLVRTKSISNSVQLNYRYLELSKFSYLPGARYERETPGTSATLFYEQHLKPEMLYSFKHNTPLVLDLDGTGGYASSFINELVVRLWKDFGQRLYSLLWIKATEDDFTAKEFDFHLQNYTADVKVQPAALPNEIILSPLACAGQY